MNDSPMEVAIGVVKTTLCEVVPKWRTGESRARTEWSCILTHLTLFNIQYPILRQLLKPFWGDRMKRCRVETGEYTRTMEGLRITILMLKPSMCV